MTLLFGLACGEGSEDCSVCELSDANNYAHSSTLDLPLVQAQSGSDVRVSWSDLELDLSGLEVPAGSIDEVTLVVFEDLDHGALMEGLAGDTLAQGDASLFAECLPAGEDCQLSEFQVLDVAVDAHTHFVPERGLFLITLGEEGVAGMKGGVVLEAVDDSSVQEVRIDDGDGALATEVDLGSLEPVRPATGLPTLDWSGVRTDGLGHPLRLQEIDTMLVGRFEEGLPELEGRIPELSVASDAIWIVDVTGEASYDLSRISSFPGVDTEGTWLVAWMCSTCTHPAPRVLTVLESP